MSDDELDRKVASILGMRQCPDDDLDHYTPGNCWTNGTGLWPKMIPEARFVLPSFTTDPADFLALLEWHAREGRFPSVHLSRRGNEWEGAIRGNFFPYCYAKERADTPLRALAMATVAWAEGREEGR